MKTYRLHEFPLPYPKMTGYSRSAYYSIVHLLVYEDQDQGEEWGEPLFLAEPQS